MATRVTLIISGEKEGVSDRVYLDETFDSVLEKVVPTSQPSSSLEARTNMTYADIHGDRVWIPPQNIGWIKENSNPDD